MLCFFFFVPRGANQCSKKKNVTDKTNHKQLGFPEHRLAQSIYRRRRLTPSHGLSPSERAAQGEACSGGPLPKWGPADLPKPAPASCPSCLLPHLPLGLPKRTEDTGSKATHPGRSFWPREGEEGLSGTPSHRAPTPVHKDRLTTCCQWGGGELGPLHITLN